MALTLESVVTELDGATDAAPMERGVRGHPPRVADGRPRELGRDPLPDPAGSRRHLLAARRGLGRRRRRRSAPGRRRRLRGGAAPGRGHHPHRGPRSAAESVERAVGDGETTLVGVFERAAVAARDAVAAHPRPPAGAARGGCRRRRRARVRAAHRRLPPRGRRHAAARARGGALVHRGRGARRPPCSWRRWRRIAELRYEVMYFLEAPDDTIDGFKAAWGALGDSIVVVGGDGIWNCHVHTDDIGAVHRGRHRGRPSARHPRHRSPRAGRRPRGGGVGARGFRCRRARAAARRA